MTRYARRKGQKSGHRERQNKTKNYKYLNEEQVQRDKGDEDLAGHGMFHCNVCYRHFVSEEVLEEHKVKSKEHKKQEKRQMREAKEEERMAALLPSTKRKRPADFDVEMSDLEAKKVKA